MKSHNTDEDVPRIDQDRKEKSYSTVRTVHTVHPPEVRVPTEVRMRRSIHNAVMRYCGSERITAGQFYEEAAILLMGMEPINGVHVITVRPPERERNLDEELQEIICIEKLENFIETKKPFKGKLHVNSKDSLLKILRECRKVKNRSAELEALMTEAMAYFK